MKDDRVYLHHILRCISRIEEYVAGSPEAFLFSHLVQDAVLRNLQTMAESTQRLVALVRGSRESSEALLSRLDSAILRAWEHDEYVDEINR